MNNKLWLINNVFISKKEGEIEEILIADFKGNFIVFHYVEIADVNLPQNIATEITNKETQKQKNFPQNYRDSFANYNTKFPDSETEELIRRVENNKNVWWFSEWRLQNACRMQTPIS